MCCVVKPHNHPRCGEKNKKGFLVVFSFSPQMQGEESPFFYDSINGLIRRRDKSLGYCPGCERFFTFRMDHCCFCKCCCSHCLEHLLDHKVYGSSDAKNKDEHIFSPTPIRHHDIRSVITTASRPPTPPPPPPSDGGGYKQHHNVFAIPTKKCDTLLRQSPPPQQSPKPPTSHVHPATMDDRGGGGKGRGGKEGGFVDADEQFHMRKRRYGSRKDPNPNPPPPSLWIHSGYYGILNE
jgi:hypothetical protein